MNPYSARIAFSSSSQYKYTLQPNIRSLPLSTSYEMVVVLSGIQSIPGLRLLCLASFHRLFYILLPLEVFYFAFSSFFFFPFLPPLAMPTCFQHCRLSSIGVQWSIFSSAPDADFLVSWRIRDSWQQKDQSVYATSPSPLLWLFVCLF